MFTLLTRFLKSDVINGWFQKSQFMHTSLTCFKYVYSLTVFPKIKNDYKKCTILLKVLFGESTYAIERKMEYKENINYTHTSYFKM